MQIFWLLQAEAAEDQAAAAEREQEASWSLKTRLYLVNI
jgi:hypothetical protein